MTYPDDVLKAAREAAIKVYHNAHKGDVYYDPRRYEARFRSGECDDDYTVQSACIAIMAERQRCAGIASRMEIGGIVETPEFITAILGQQEGAIGALEQDVDAGEDHGDSDWVAIATKRLESARKALARAKRGGK